MSSLADPVGSQPVCTGTASSTCTNLSYIPFASDGNAYAYKSATSDTTADCNALADLPSSVFKALYTANTGSGGSGILTPTQGGWTGTKTLEACAIQSGSGIWSAFLTQIGSGLSAAQGDTNLTGAGTSNCNSLEPNNLNLFLSAGSASGGGPSASPSADWVIPLSVGSLIGQHNGVALDRSSTFLATTTGQGIAPVADDFSRSAGTPVTLESAVSAGATSMTIQLEATLGSCPVVLNLNPGGGDAESVTVNGTPTGSHAAGWTIPITATANAHTAGETVTATFSEPYCGAGTATWTPNTTYLAGVFGSWMSVVVPSALINPVTGASGQDFGLEDLFDSPESFDPGPSTSFYNGPGEGGEICQTPYTTEAALFGFDPSLPDNATQFGAHCGNVAYTQVGVKANNGG